MRMLEFNQNMYDTDENIIRMEVPARGWCTIFSDAPKYLDVISQHTDVVKRFYYFSGYCHKNNPTFRLGNYLNEDITATLCVKFIFNKV